MIVLCTICSDLINPSENIFVTKCGHLFHYDCLHTWIVKAKSCPQCRHRVTEKCMFRIFPTTTDGTPSGDETAANLQMKLDHTMLKLNQQNIELKSCNDEITKLKTVLKSAENSVKTLEEKIVSKDSAIASLKEHMLYVKTENNRLKKLQEELEIQKKNVQLLQGLQKVFNATVEEVEHMLEGYPDVRTVATFATALKKALCESESKRTELRNRLQAAEQKFAEEKKLSADRHSKFLQLEENFSTVTKKYEAMKNKLKENKEASYFNDSWCLNKSKILFPNNSANEIITNTSNTSLNTLINRIENADSPYLNLKQSSLAWAALQHPTKSNETVPLKPLKLKSPQATTTKVFHSLSDRDNPSIFNYKDPASMEFSADNDQSKSELSTSYDGLGGHAKFSDMLPMPRTMPLKPKSAIPKLTAKHRLKRPNPVIAQNIGEMFKKLRDK